MRGVLSLKPSYYEALKRLTLEMAGINLGSDHMFLIETRLSALARREGYEDLPHMIEELFGSGQARLALRVVSALLQRDTHFYPDPVGMKNLEEIVFPELIKKYGQKEIRILSFGCNSGQETYSVAMMVEKLKAQYKHMSIAISGVDYPSPALNRASKGLYTHFEVQRGLPIRDLIKFFDRQGEDWVVKPHLRERVRFKEYHLLSNLSDLGIYHLIIFRNGLPHYSQTARVRVLRGLSDIVEPGGYLMLGSDEQCPILSYGFDPVPHMPGLLRRDGAVDEEEDDGRELRAKLVFDKEKNWNRLDFLGSKAQ